jgi:ribonuclease VapC
LILDSSAIVSVVREEDGHGRLSAALEEAPSVAVGTPTLFETAMVLVGSTGAPGHRILSSFLADNGIVSIPFDERHWFVAADAYIRYGKGRHPAKLNFGDCMTYATAHLADHPLLFIGEDFAKTDIASALG